MVTIEGLNLRYQFFPSCATMSLPSAITPYGELGDVHYIMFVRFPKGSPDLIILRLELLVPVNCQVRSVISIAMPTEPVSLGPIIGMSRFRRFSEYFRSFGWEVTSTYDLHFTHIRAHIPRWRFRCRVRRSLCLPCLIHLLF